jgi:hypothetical protein
MSHFYGIVRNRVKPFVPARLRAMRSRRRISNFNRSMSGKSTPEIFDSIYSKRMWGFSPAGGKYSSGLGSYERRAVEPYIASISRFVESFSFRLDAVDLGCGDFAIGSKLRPLFNRYIAGDIVADVIARNRNQYKSLDVDFRVINIAEDDLPPGDVVFVRQVLQHLSNHEIARALDRIQATYPQLILTEHLPLENDFLPNIDIGTGPDIRLAVKSGVDITKAPFEVPVTNAVVLCEVAHQTTRIRTTLYDF